VKTLKKEFLLGKKVVEEGDL